MKCPYRVTSIYGSYMTDELGQHLIVQTIVPKDLLFSDAPIYSKNNCPADGSSLC